MQGDYLNNTKYTNDIYMAGLHDVCVDCNRCVYEYSRRSPHCAKCTSNILYYLPDLSDQEVELWLKQGKRPAEGMAWLWVKVLAIIAFLVWVFTV